MFLHSRLFRLIGHTNNNINNSTNTIKSFIKQCSSSPSRFKERVFLNEVRLLGRVGNDPELRGTQSTICSFSLATDTYWNNSEGAMMQRTDWHRIACGLPSLRDKVMRTVVKGDRVLVLGSLHYRQYKDGSGNNRTSSFVMAGRILNLTNRKLNSETENFIPSEFLNNEVDDQSFELATDDDYNDNKPPDSQY